MLLDLLKTRVVVSFSKSLQYTVFAKVVVKNSFLKERKSVVFIKVPGLLFVTLAVHNVLLFDSGDRILLGDGSALRVD